MVLLAIDNAMLTPTPATPPMPAPTEAAPTPAVIVAVSEAETLRPPVTMLAMALPST
jgi:hypothetical protein